MDWHQSNRDGLEKARAAAYQQAAASLRDSDVGNTPPLTMQIESALARANAIADRLEGVLGTISGNVRAGSDTGAPMPCGLRPVADALGGALSRIENATVLLGEML